MAGAHGLARERVREDRSSGVAASPRRRWAAGRRRRMTLRRADRRGWAARRPHNRAGHRHPRVRQAGSYSQGMIRGSARYADQRRTARAEDRAGHRRSRGRRQRRAHCHRTLETSEYIRDY